VRSTAGVDSDRIFSVVSGLWPAISSWWNTHWFQTYTPVSPPGSPVKCVDRLSGNGHAKAQVAST
jgi:hypothetical protein